MHPIELEQRLAKRNWIVRDTNPDIYVVCTMYKGLWHDNGRSSTYQRGDVIGHQKLACSLRHRLSKAVYGNRYDKTKKRTGTPMLLPMAGTLEGDGLYEHFHFNLFLKRPQWLTFQQFKALFHEIWFVYPWAHRSEKHAVYFEEITDECFWYSLKQGSDTLLIL